MSGLAALHHRDGRPVSRQLLDDMLAVIPYRGADGQHVWSANDVGLGHTLFAVTPEDRMERQPRVSPRTGCVLIADVRLDNRDELLHRLRGAAPSATDAELILHAYDTWGLNALPELLGDFALVIWDPRTRQLVCARDSSGQRTLFYRIDARTCAVASEIHQLFQDPHVLIAPNIERVREGLLPRNLLRNEAQVAETFYAGIMALSPGHVLVVASDSATVRAFWQFSPGPELKYRTDQQYVEHFRALFSDVVRARLRSRGPLGVLLSGGLDSGSIACVSQTLFRQGLAANPGFTSFTMAYDGLECDERPFIEDMEASYGFTTRFVSSGGFGGRLQLEPRGFREAPNLGVSEARDALMREVTGSGVRAVLTGDIADACVGGGPLVFDSLLRQARLPSLRRQLGAYHRASGESWRRILLTHTLLPLAPLGLQRKVHERQISRAWQRVQSRIMPAWMPDDLRRDLGRRQLQRSVEAERARMFANPIRQSEYELLYPSEVARHTAPWPVELWRPFADRRLHAFLLSIPPEQKYAPAGSDDGFYAGSKRLLRRAMHGILPDSIRLRTVKTVFNAALEQEVMRHWPTYEAAFGPGSHSEIAAYGLVEPARFWDRLQQMRAGMIGADLVYVLHLAGLETWLRGFHQPRLELIRTDQRRSFSAASRSPSVTTGRQHIHIGRASTSTHLTNARVDVVAVQAPTTEGRR